MKDQFFADYLERLENLQHRLHKAVRELPAEAMDWSPGPAMNSVAVLLAHIAGVLHEGIAIALNEPPGRVREQEFQTRGVLSTEMLCRLDAVIDYARGALPCCGRSCGHACQKRSALAMAALSTTVSHCGMLVSIRCWRSSCAMCLARRSAGRCPPPFCSTTPPSKILPCISLQCSFRC